MPKKKFHVELDTFADSALIDVLIRKGSTPVTTNDSEPDPTDPPGPPTKP